MMQWVVIWEPPINKGMVARVFDEQDEASAFAAAQRVAGWTDARIVPAPGWPTDSVSAEPADDGKASGGLTHGELVVACKNIGFDLTCGACASIFFCGMGLPNDTHTCDKTWGAKAQSWESSPNQWQLGELHPSSAGVTESLSGLSTGRPGDGVQGQPTSEAVLQCNLGFPHCRAVHGLGPAGSNEGKTAEGLRRDAFALHDAGLLAESTALLDAAKARDELTAQRTNDAVPGPKRKTCIDCHSDSDMGMGWRCLDGAACDVRRKAKRADEACPDARAVAALEREQADLFGPRNGVTPEAMAIAQIRTVIDWTVGQPRERLDRIIDIDILDALSGPRPETALPTGQWVRFDVDERTVTFRYDSAADVKAVIFAKGRQSGPASPTGSGA